MRTPKIIATALCTAALALAGTAAVADTFYNDLDATIDADTANEVININTIGGTGSTVIALREDGHEVSPKDHPNCNINGVPHYVTISATSSDPAVATVALTPDGTFNLCTDTATATVTAVSVGTATITFSIVDKDTETAGDPHIYFNTDEAAFVVNVGDSGNPNTGCDAHPAAPAWANAILQASGVKSKVGNTNYVSIIAGEMGLRATFGGFEKDDPQYPEAVRNRLLTLTGKSLKTVAQSARPGWECTALPS